MKTWAFWILENPKQNFWIPSFHNFLSHSFPFKIVRNFSLATYLAKQKTYKRNIETQIKQNYEKRKLKMLKVWKCFNLSFGFEKRFHFFLFSFWMRAFITFFTWDHSRPLTFLSTTKASHSFLMGTLQFLMWSSKWAKISALSKSDSIFFSLFLGVFFASGWIRLSSSSLSLFNETVLTRVYRKY